MAVTTVTLNGWVERLTFLLAVDQFGLELLLNVSKKLLHWVQEWRVLGVVEHMGTEVLHCPKQQGDAMCGSVVHQHQHLLTWVGDLQTGQCLEQKVLIKRGVKATFDDLD